MDRQKQKQIEEMAKDMLEYSIGKYPAGESVFTETKLREQFYHVFLTYAEYLINKGYCKIHEGVVVLTGEEYNGLVEKIINLSTKIELYQGLLNDMAGVRKETAEKFAEMLKADVSEDNELHEALNAYLKRDYFEYIDERRKELTEGKV